RRWTSSIPATASPPTRAMARRCTPARTRWRRPSWMTAEASDAPALARTPSSPLQAAARRLRSLVRRSEFSLVILAAIIGVAAGLSVALIGTLSSDMHNLLFGLTGERLSGVKHLK